MDIVTYPNPDVDDELVEAWMRDHGAELEAFVIERLLDAGMIPAANDR